MLALLSADARTAVERRRAELVVDNHGWTLDASGVPAAFRCLIEDAEFFSPFTFYTDEAASMLSPEYVEGVLGTLEQTASVLEEILLRVESSSAEAPLDHEAHAFFQLHSIVESAAWRLGLRQRPPVDHVAIKAIIHAITSPDKAD